MHNAMELRSADELRNAEELRNANELRSAKELRIEMYQALCYYGNSLGIRRSTWHRQAMPGKLLSQLGY